MDMDIELNSGLNLIIAERHRQVNEEGCTLEHDAQHDGGELAVAAACYAVNGLNDGSDSGTFVQHLDDGIVNDGWPFEDIWDKREKHGRIRSLAIAGALIAAEIDRLHAEFNKAHPKGIDT
jgi:hypothetical protein